MDIADVVKAQCAGVFGGDQHMEASFGVATKGEAMMLLQLCAPEVHYSTRGFTYRFLPASFKALVTRPGSFHEEFGSDTLYAFHHIFSVRRAARKLHEFAKAEKRLERQVGEEQFRRTMGRPPLDARAYLRRLCSRYENPTCIRMNLWGYSSLLGEYEINDRAMKHMKQGAEQTFELLGELVPPYVTHSVRREKRMVALYDFFRRPVENVYRIGMRAKA